MKFGWMIFLIASVAHGRELSSRLGLGFSDQFGLSSSMPGVAVRYYPTSDFGIMGILGVDTQKDASQFGFLAKAFKVVFKEQNLNFYVGAGAGIVSQQNKMSNGTTSNDSGFIADGFVGTEFFLAGLENLGFSVETGVGITSISSQVRFRTLGDSPLRAGIVFYF